MPVLKVNRELLCSPVVWSLCGRRVLPVYHVVLLLSGEGRGVVEGQLGDLDVSLLLHTCGLPVVSDLQVSRERKVRAPYSCSEPVLTPSLGGRKVLRAEGGARGGGAGGSRLWTNEDSVCVLRPYEVMRGLGGDVMDLTGDIPLHQALISHTQSPVR